jgi:hypothetical protein
MAADSNGLPPMHIQSLRDDVQRYEGFGVHRYGSPGAEAALDWLADELAQAGLAVTEQHFTMERQYDFQSGALEIGGRRIELMPHWWSPEDRASFSISTTFGRGGLERVALPFDRGAYLNDGHRASLAEAFARKPQAVLLSIDHPSGEIFTYNVDQASASWPVPVMLVATKHSASLDAAERDGTKVTIEVAGGYRHEVGGRNIVARLDRGKGKWLVVSTPVTSWFTSTCERGPGIAGFLAVARQATRSPANVDLVFAATSGHEIGHGGMDRFLKDGAPPPHATLAWAHFGASLACRDPIVRVVNSSTPLLSQVGRHFAAIEGQRLVGKKAAIGELREVHAAGYARFFGMAGSHRLFHTPADTIAGLAADELAAVTRAFAGVLTDVAANG